MNKKIKKRVFMSVIQAIEEVNQGNYRRKEPINCIEKLQLMEICKKFGATRIEIGVLLRVATAITYGLLKSRADLEKIESDNLGQIYVQLEQIRTILNN